MNERDPKKWYTREANEHLIRQLDEKKTEILKLKEKLEQTIKELDHTKEEKNSIDAALTLADAKIEELEQCLIEATKARTVEVEILKAIIDAVNLNSDKQILDSDILRLAQAADIPTAIRSFRLSQ